MKKASSKATKARPTSKPAKAKKPAAKAATTPAARARRPARDEMRPEYDFSAGVRGKYAARYAEGTNVVVLEPDVAAEFRDGDEVNRALRAWLKERSARASA